MAALLVVLSLLLGSSVTSIGAISTLGWITIAANAAAAGGQGIKLIEALKAMGISPQSPLGIQSIATFNDPGFRAWVAANGEAAIRLQPGACSVDVYEHRNCY